MTGNQGETGSGASMRAGTEYIPESDKKNTVTPLTSGFNRDCDEEKREKNKRRNEMQKNNDRLRETHENMNIAMTSARTLMVGNTPNVEHANLRETASPQDRRHP